MQKWIFVALITGLIFSISSGGFAEEVINIEGKTRAQQDAGKKEKPRMKSTTAPFASEKPVGVDAAKNLKLLEAEKYKAPEKKKNPSSDFLRNPALYILILFGLIIGSST